MPAVLRSLRFMSNMFEHTEEGCRPLGLLPVPLFLTFFPDFTTQVLPIGWILLTHTLLEKRLQETLLKKTYMSGDWMSVMLNPSQRRKMQQTQSKWMLCPRCYQLVILSSVATLQSVSMPRSPIWNNVPAGAWIDRRQRVWGRCFKFCCSALVPRFKRFSSRRPPSCLTCLPLSLTSSFSARCVFIPAVDFFDSLLQDHIIPSAFCPCSDFDPALCKLCFRSTAAFWTLSTLTTCSPFSYLTFETFDYTQLSLVPNSSQP